VEEPEDPFPILSSSVHRKDGVATVTSDSHHQVPFLIRSVNGHTTALEPMKDLRMRVAEPVSTTYRDEGDLWSELVQEFLRGGGSAPVVAHLQDLHTWSEYPGQEAFLRIPGCISGKKSRELS